jgi:MYXO-CTERM domain-containing protein
LFLTNGFYLVSAVAFVVVVGLVAFFMRRRRR